jgi:lipopolysaccharide/colanic/teichoic acid biosynthesis glycosyltransferase
MTPNLFIKRLFDLFFSLIGLVLLSPLFFILALWIKLDSQGPVFFRQSRVGLHGKPFRIYKFRTMFSGAESQGRQITVGDDPRITASGRFLRKYKFDELPQLINVFLGDMSLVGPRPEVPRYVEMFKIAYGPVLQVQPGITDYAAIEFRDEEEVLKKYDNPEEGYIKEVLPRKIEFYQRYLRERGFWTDLKLIFRTLQKLV